MAPVLLFFAAVACGRPPSGDPVSAVQTACERLRGTGFAKTCSGPHRSPTGAFVDFEPTNGFPGETGRVAFGPAEVGPPPALDADQVIFVASSPKTKLTIGMLGLDSTWARCVSTASVDACAKKFPLQYAWHRALHEEALRIVEDEADPGPCERGYLCRGHCTPHGNTCCIDAKPTGHSCPDAGPCLPGGSCQAAQQTAPAAAAAPPPAAVRLCGSGCQCGDGSCGCCGRGCCSHHGGIR